jgi:hypothetical protein
MKKLFLLFGIMALTSVAKADTFFIKNDPHVNFKVGFNGGAQGVTEELFGYLAAGLKPITNPNGNPGFESQTMWGWKEEAPTLNYTVIMVLQPFDLERLDLSSTFAPSEGHNEDQTGSFKLPSGLSYTLYDFMLKAGLRPRTGDGTQTLSGKRVFCTGYPDPRLLTGLSPSCIIKIR